MDQNLLKRKVFLADLAGTPLKKKSGKQYLKGSLNFMIHLCVFRGLQVSSAWNKITFFSLLLCTELSLDGQMMILTKTFISTASYKKLCWGDIFLNASGRCYRINTIFIFQDSSQQIYDKTKKKVDIKVPCPSRENY